MYRYNKRSSDVYHEFAPRSFQPYYDISLIEQDFDNPTQGNYYCEIELPYGEVIPEIIYYYIQTSAEDTQKKEIKVNMDDVTGQFQFEKIPNPLPQMEIQKKIKQSIDAINDSLIKET
jgi:hypothetical protein